MPTVVGDTKSFTMYESLSYDGIKGCKALSHAATVTRCSGLNSDYVYRLEDKMSSGADTVCGMEGGAERLTTTTDPTTTFSSTTNHPQCTSKLTLTESWRNDSPNKPGGVYHNDMGLIDGGKTWFTFDGDAGKELKNTCPTQYSCGSTGSYWSDDPMPTAVGETRSFKIYESWSKDGHSNCKAFSYDATVTKCRGSVNDFYVYRLDDRMSGGDDTICGMN